MAVDDVELSSSVCITVSCIVTTDNEVPTSDVVVVELCEEGPLNNDEVLSTWLEDLEAAGFLLDCFDCFGGCDAFLTFL